MKLKYKILLGFAISVFFLALSFKDVELELIAQIDRTFHYRFLFVALLIWLLIPLARGFRLKLMLTPIARMDFSRAFAYNSISLFFIVTLPFRLGEFALPFLLKRENIPFSTVLAIVFLERLLDMSILSALIVSMTFLIDVPTWIEYAGIVVAVSALVALIVLMFIRDYSRLVALLDALIDKLPEAPAAKLREIKKNIAATLPLVNSLPRMLAVFAVSAGIWSLAAAVIYCLLLFFKIDADLVASFFIMLVNSFGIALPAGPGQIGNFQYSCIFAMKFFYDDAALNFLFANFYYLFMLTLTSLIGLFYYWRYHLSFKKILDETRIN